MLRPVVYYEPGAPYGGGFHCEGVSNDYTLCGYSLDQDQGAIEEVKNNPPRIDCPGCLAIIHYCRKLSARTFTSERRSVALPSTNRDTEA